MAILPHVCPVAITGMGCITAAGDSLAQTLATMEQGRCQPHPPQGLDAPYEHLVFTCTLPSALLEGEGGIPLAAYSRTVQLAVHAARQALASAQLTPEDIRSSRVGICLGTSVGASPNFLDFYKAYNAKKDRSLDAVNSYRISSPATALAGIFGCQGPAHTITNACSSGVDAIGQAATWIRQGLCDIVMAGGADEFSETSYRGFGSLRLMSTKPCAPFDKNRNGLNLGEGAGFFVLESDASLCKRKVPVRATVLGYGTCTDAYHLTAPHPEGKGLTRALEQAFSQAGLSASSMAFINAHGTATPTSDAAEGTFLRTTFPDIPFIATKGCTGHTLGAAGAIEAIFTAAHLGQGALPASPGFIEADPEIGTAPVCVPTIITGAAALSQSLAFGGNSSLLIVGKGEGA